MLKNNKGFSLIELMVVVAIIAILSTIAIPSYQSFQAKAQQKEGFALLSGYYTAAQATRAEHNFFPGNLVSTGFAPTGQLTYRLTADQNQNLPYGSNDSACITTALACDCTADSLTCPGFRTWQEKAAGVVGTTTGPVAATSGAIAVTSIAFTVAVSGVISTTADSADEYTMDQLKNLSMVIDGIQ